MQRIIVVSLPVADVAASRAFYTGVGFTVDDRFCDERSASVVVSGTIVVMLLHRDRFAELVATPVADAHAVTQVLHCLSASSRAEVDAFVDAAVTHGGEEHRAPVDAGTAYGRAVVDPDGHVWEMMHTELPAGVATP